MGMGVGEREGGEGKGREEWGGDGWQGGEKKSGRDAERGKSASLTQGMDAPGSNSLCNSRDLILFMQCHRLDQW